MATGLGIPKKENLNFARLCRLLIDGGTRALREVFNSIHSPSSSLHATLLGTPVHSTLRGLRARRILTTQQWDRLYPASRGTTVTSADFDITLLFVLLRNICGLTPPPTGWDRPPVATDLSREADLARVKYYRNELYGHTTEAAVSDSDFEKYWKEISDVLVRLGGPHYKPEIERLKIEAMDVEDEKYFIKILEEWEQTEQSLKTAIKNTEQRVMDELKEIKVKQEEIKEKLGNHEIPEKGDAAINVTYNITVKDHGSSPVGHDASLTNVETTREHPVMEKDLSRALEYTEKLKSSIQKQTNFLLTSEEEDKKIRTDDIFTNVTIERGKKQFKEPEELKSGRRQMDEIETSRTKLTTCSEMFVSPANDDQKSTASSATNPKSILLTGKAGIGKSLFCHKLMRDWSHDRLFEKEQNAEVPDFPFVFLLTFRQLTRLQDKEDDLRGLLNRSPLLDGNSMLDEPLLQYIIDNPEKVLVILDGYDEYKQREKITGDFETEYPNDPHKKIPVPALIAKIMKGKMLEGSVVLISSRPGEAEELSKIPFDVRCYIEGFSSLQVLEYIGKYFKEKESMKKKVLEHMKLNEVLLSFGHIPVMCFLMCYCIKWYMAKTQTTEKLPVTRTELYYQVIILFIKKHSSSKYEEMEESKVQEILHKLAELAVNLTIEEKYIFDEHFMKKFKFTEEEITNLKASGLLDCCPGVKKSPADQPPLEYSFSHLTLQEFLAAFSFVEKNQIPEKEKTSDVIFTFMAGLYSRVKDLENMTKLMKNIKPKNEDDKRKIFNSKIEDEKDMNKLTEFFKLENEKDERNKMLTLSCLYEYKDDGFSTTVIKNLQHTYCDSNGEILFGRIIEIDCLYISYLLDIVNLINEQQTKQHPTFTQSFIVNALNISVSSLSASGIRMLCNSLVSLSTVTELKLWYCGLDDECVKIISDMLSRTNIIGLFLSFNNITGAGVQSLCRVLRDSRVKWLYLQGNAAITSECKRSAEQQFPGVRWLFDE